MEFYNINYIYFSFLSILMGFILYLGYHKKNRVYRYLKLKEKSPYLILVHILAFTLIILSLIGPRILSDSESIDLVGADIYILIDTSESMMVDDIMPNRLAKAKYEIENIIKGLNGDRIGFIPFANDAYVQMPLTDDYSMALMYLDVIDGDLFPQRNKSNFQEAINLAKKSFRAGAEGDKVILILSSGHGEASIEIKENIYIYTIGVGSSQGGLIPTKDGFARDNSGNPILSSLNRRVLQSLTHRGKYYESNNINNVAQSFLRDIEQLKRAGFRQEEINLYREFYQYLLFLGFILMLLCHYLEERKR